jgi:lipid II isoglutaminyl synthase (glutamine-hydrolysing)
VTPGVRTRLAAAATRLVGVVSRSARAGSGTVIGGKVGLAIDPALVAHLVAGRPVAAVSGTNGKTTTTALLAAALSREGAAAITNSAGANMPAGHAAALAAGAGDGPVVLEVDEGYLPATVDSLSPAAAVLLNLSRDQLDRTNEVRMVAGRWRASLARARRTTVVANADDPLVAWGAGQAARVVWVAAGLGWRFDAVGCPACGGRISFEETPEGGWSCSCGFSRPTPDVQVVDLLEGEVEAVWADGRHLPVKLGIPGRFNRSNAVLAAAAAEAMGVPATEAFGAMIPLQTVAGRFGLRRIGGVPTRLMLAKNPAGWHELLALVGAGSGPVVVAINARIADGRDPSWLWDVSFEELAGRPVVATGDRCLDLAVRLRYAEVDHATVRDPLGALQAASRMEGPSGSPVDFIGNYTAFHDLSRLG